MKDNHEEATIGAFLFCELVQMLADSSDLDDEIDELLQAFEAKSGRPVLHTVVFYWYEEGAEAPFARPEESASGVLLIWCSMYNLES